MNLNAAAIQRAAASKLRNLGRLSLSEGGFSREQADAIAAAIAAAIEAYDKQRNEEES